MVRPTPTPHIFLFLFVIWVILSSKTFAQKQDSPKAAETSTRSRNPAITHRNRLQRETTQGSVRKRVVTAGGTQEGSIYDGLRSDYLVTITLPWTLAMFGFVVFILICMRTDGWLYHLFTDDYVPPAVKKRMEEEARRTEGRKARLERVDNWNEVCKTWESNIKETSERVRATMPPNIPTGRCQPPPQNSSTVA